MPDMPDNQEILRMLADAPSEDDDPGEPEDGPADEVVDDHAEDEQDAEPQDDAPVDEEGDNEDDDEVPDDDDVKYQRMFEEQFKGDPKKAMKSFLHLRRKLNEVTKKPAPPEEPEEDDPFQDDIDPFAGIPDEAPNMDALMEEFRENPYDPEINKKFSTGLMQNMVVMSKQMARRQSAAMELKQDLNVIAEKYPQHKKEFKKFIQQARTQKKPSLRRAFEFYLFENGLIAKGGGSDEVNDELVPEERVPRKKVTPKGGSYLGRTPSGKPPAATRRVSGARAEANDVFGDLF